MPLQFLQSRKLHAGNEHQLRPVVYTSCTAAGAAGAKMTPRGIVLSPGAAEGEGISGVRQQYLPTGLQGEKPVFHGGTTFLRRLSNHPRCTAGGWTFASGGEFSELTTRPWCAAFMDLAGLWLSFFRGYHGQRQGSRMTGIQGHFAVVGIRSESASRVAVRVLSGSERDPCRQGKKGESRNKFVHHIFLSWNEQTRQSAPRAALTHACETAVGFLPRHHDEASCSRLKLTLRLSQGFARVRSKCIRMYANLREILAGPGSRSLRQILLQFLFGVFGRLSAFRRPNTRRRRHRVRYTDAAEGGAKVPPLDAVS